MDNNTIEELLRIAEEAGRLPANFTGVTVTTPSGVTIRKYVRFGRLGRATVMVSAQRSCLIVHGKGLIGPSVTAVSITADSKDVDMILTDTRENPRYSVDQLQREASLEEEADSIEFCKELMDRTERRHSEEARWKTMNQTPRRVRWDLVQELRAARAREIVEHVISVSHFEWREWKRWSRSAFGRPTTEHTARALAMAHIATSLHDDITNGRTSPRQVGRAIARAIARNPRGREALPGQRWLDSLLKRDDMYLEQHRGGPLVRKPRRSKQPEQFPF